jgi:3-dehydroquinate dehydratase-2
MKKFMIINGPNLNMLGKREPEVYGSLTLQEIEKYTNENLDQKEVKLDWYQSNIEGEIVSKIQDLAGLPDFNGLVINPAAYSHTSVAIYDALMLLQIPIIEVHLTNTHKREDFRQVKITARAAKYCMEGLGKNAYLMAIKSLLL